MFLRLKLSSMAARVSLAAGVLAFCALLFGLILSKFIIGTLADDRLEVTSQMLQIPLQYFPNSPRLNARIASAELNEIDRDLDRAANHAQRAINFSPYDYRIRVTQASVKEAQGDRSAAESSLEAARSLAPNYWNVNYRLGNLLIRQGKLQQSIDPFRVAVAGNSTLLPGTLDLLWRASRNDVKTLETVAGPSSKAKLTLARFLLKESRPTEAVGIFGSIDPDTLRTLPESTSFLNGLIGVGELSLARDLWGKLTGANDGSALLWNGSFETDPQKTFPQFDWSFARSEYARFTIDASVAHSGSRSFKIEFAGRDTTQLNNEIKQLVLVEPGKRYQLECYVKTNGLESPEGPKLFVSNNGSSETIATSDPVANGSNDWQRLTVDFVAPAAKGDKSAVLVSIKRKPKFSYDEPTRGTVWFDDFSIKEQ